MSLLIDRLSLRSATSMEDVEDQNSMSFRGGRVPRPSDVFIAVMGVTGSGKSSFISTCSEKAVNIGHQLKACTTTVDVYAYDISSSHTVFLIDTPGFDDTSRSDTEVLREIASWLGASYRSNILLHGIIYLHRITDIRMQGSARRNLILFRQLCGQEALKKVILVTTMWDKVLVEDGIKREGELIDNPDFWGWMLGKGSTCHRHNNTEDSARGIVGNLVGHKAPITTDLQRQLVDENKSLDQTSAGIELQSEMLKEKTKWAQEKKEIEQQMQIAIQKHDHEAEEMMREERDRYTRLIKKVEDDTVTLRSTMHKLLYERDQRVARMEKQMRKQQAAHKVELERLSERQRLIEREKVELENQQRQREKEDLENQQRRREKEELENQQRQKDKDELEKHRRWREREELEKQQRRREKDGHDEALQKQSQVSAPTPNMVFAPYSLTVVDGRFMCIGPKTVMSNASYPPRKQGSEFATAASLGDFHNGARVWIAGYGNGIWYRSRCFGHQYPKLEVLLDQNAEIDLELCSLGPGDTYYARWRDGSWACRADGELFEAVSKAHSDGQYIKAIGLGYGGSYVISIGLYSSTTSWLNLGLRSSLKGYYPGLQKFLDENVTTTSTAAIALDMSNGTDYQIVYRDNKDGATHTLWRISDGSLNSTVRTWWDAQR